MKKALKTFYNINSEWKYPDSGLEMKEYFDYSMEINNIDPNKSYFKRWDSKKNENENETNISSTLQFELETKKGGKCWIYGA